MSHVSEIKSVPYADRCLLCALVAYAVASLVHFVHNAEFLRDYPNMPTSITRTIIYSTWLGIFALGVNGYVIYRRFHEYVGMAMLAIYCALGFDGLLHYTLAPVASHSRTMNLTIAGEVCAAAIALGLLITVLLARVRRTTFFPVSDR